MRHERATEELRETAALYALGSLTQHEAQSYEIHLQEKCSVCRAELRKFQRIVAGIGLAAEEAAAPDYIRDLLLARVERISRSPAPIEVPSKAIATEPPQEKPPPLRPARPILSQTPQPKPKFQMFFLIAIATGLGLIAFNAWRTARQDNAQLQRKLSAAQADAENLRILLDVQKGRVGELEQILAMVRRPGARIARLSGQAISPTVSGAILWDAQQGRCLTIGYLPPEPEGKIYQLWFFTPAEKIPAGALKVDPTGRTYTSFAIPPGISGAVEIAVTMEPDNGSGIPTMPLYATARIQ